MEATPYSELSDIQLLSLCCYREARGEPLDAKRGVCWTIRNRTLNPGWWGSDWSSVILKPWQFSSFNRSDPNSNVWPTDETETAWLECLTAAGEAYEGTTNDPTEGATYYHDTSMGWPSAWGVEADYLNTLNVGRLRFYKRTA